MFFLRHLPFDLINVGNIKWARLIEFVSEDGLQGRNRWSNMNRLEKAALPEKWLASSIPELLANWVPFMFYRNRLRGAVSINISQPPSDQISGCLCGWASSCSRMGLHARLHRAKSQGVPCFGVAYPASRATWRKTLSVFQRVNRRDMMSFPMLCSFFLGKLKKSISK